MANKFLKTIKFPGLPDTYKIADLDAREAIASDYSSSSTYAIGDYVWYEGDLYRCVSAISVGEAWDSTHWEVTSISKVLENYAQIDGYYEDLTSGSTEEVISNVKITDQEPYTFRTSGGNAEIASREEDTLVGVSVAFNQLAKEINSTNWVKSSGTLSFDNGVASFTVNRQYGACYCYLPTNPIDGHKYLLAVDVKMEEFPSLQAIRFALGDTAYSQRVEIYFTSSNCTNNTWNRLYCIGSYYPNGHVANRLSVQDNRPSDWTEIQFKNPQAVDLTLMFGSDIADYLYTLEQAQAGEGVALAKKLGLNKYLSYNAGTLYSAQTDAHKMTGFNQWDEEWEVGVLENGGVPAPASNAIRSKNFCDIIGGQTYYMTCGKTDRGSQNRYYLRIIFYDANQNFISAGYYNLMTFNAPTNARYFKICTNTSTVVYGATYNNDICISIHWDNSRDTDYEPYVLHNYPIDPVVLRGILKKDADGNIYADGDTYEADGTVTRRYGIVDLGTLTYTKAEGFSTKDCFYTALSSLPKFPNYSSTKAPNAITPLFSPSYQNASVWNIGTFIMTSGAGVVPASSLAFIAPLNQYADASAFKAAMNGKNFVYELVVPTTEQATPFTTPQIVDNWGTEEYPDYAVAQGDREYSVPMGHTTLYPISIRDKVEASADNPSNDGVYVLQISGGKATYIPLIIEDELPTAPTQDGTYTLKTVVSSGTATLSWVAE